MNLGAFVIADLLLFHFIHVRRTLALDNRGPANAIRIAIFDLSLRFLLAASFVPICTLHLCCSGEALKSAAWARPFEQYEQR